MASPAEYLIRRGIALQHAGRDEEAITVYREAVVLDPDSHAAWGNLAMLLLRRDRAGAAAAFAEFLRVAPADHPFTGLATTTVREVGLAVPSARPGDAAAQAPTVQFIVNAGGKRSLMIAENDSGVELSDLNAVLAEFIEAPSWLDAYMILAGHPELLSGLAGTLLDVYANQGDDRGQAHQAQVNLDVLARGREIGMLAAFAEADQTPVGEFGDLVRARRDIEPVLIGLNGLPPDEFFQRLDDVPWLSRDDGTYLYIARQAESASDERRVIFAVMRQLLERHARGEPAPADDGPADHGPGAELVRDLEQAAEAAADDAAGQVAEAGTRLLASVGGDELSGFWRVEVARVVAQSLLRLSTATNDPAVLGPAGEVLAAVAALPVPGTWQDAVVEVTRANVAIRQYELGGDESVLATAAERLTAARDRVGRYRIADAPILRVLGNIQELRSERTGDPGLLRQAVELLSAAENITLREDNSWLVTQLGLIRALLALAGQGEADAMSRSERIVDDLIRRYGAEPGARERVWEIAGRVASQRHRWTGEIADLDKAVRCYQVALDFGETKPADRVHIDSNLAFALVRRYQASGSADDLQRARRHAESALSGMPAEAAEATLMRRNLARVYLALGTDEAERRATELFRLDLRVLPAGQARTTAALNLAITLFNRIAAGQSSAAESGPEAYEAYAEGMQTLDAELMPWESADFGESLGILFLELGGWQQAAISFAQAIEGIEVLSGLTPTGQWPEGSSQRFDQIVQLGAYCAGRAGRAEQAVTWLETHRTRALRRALTLDDSALTALAAAGHDELARSYATRANELRSFGLSSAEGDDSFMARRRRVLRHQLGQLAQRIRAIPGFERFCAAPDVEDCYRAAADTKLVYIAVTSLGGLAFLVDGTDRSIQTVELPEVESETVATRARAYLAALDAYRADTSDATALRGWLGELDSVREWLWTALVQPLTSALTGEHRHVTVVPSGLLGLLPVTSAQSPDRSQQAIDVADWRFAPSAEALLAARRSAARADRHTALVVLDPQPTGLPSLRWANVEAAALRAHSGDLTSLAGPDATAAAVLRAMPNHTMLHFSCHGTAYLDQPLDSYLSLAANTKLTVRALAEEGRLWGARLCFLSACDSSAAGTMMPQEVVALPSTLIQLGAAAVIASQWPVTDAAAAVLAVRFYQACAGGMPPAAAFTQAQRWLRTATRTQISALLRQHAGDIGELPELIAELPFDRVPFARAQDWAAFSYTGC